MFHPCDVNQWFRQLGLGGLAEHDSCPIQWSVGPAQHEMLLLPDNADEVLIIRHVHLSRIWMLECTVHALRSIKEAADFLLGMSAMIN